VFTPSSLWKRKAFNGLAQVIVQSEGKPGEVILKANSPGLSEKALRIHTQDDKSY
jgi:beta-galactosidase